jgi:acetate kinase
MEFLTLAINPGSSSYEYSLFSGKKNLLNAYYEHDGIGNFELTVNNQPFQKISGSKFSHSLASFLKLIEQELNLSAKNIEAVGIRLVVPGTKFARHQLLTDEIEQSLKGLVKESPVHLPIELEKIKQEEALLPGVKVYLISDTAFHSTIPASYKYYAIPKIDSDRMDIKRFGYHGISMQSIVRSIRDDLKLKVPKVIVCHLGSGSSITAINNYQSVNNSMGFSPLEGLVMASRSGNIDISAALEIKDNLKLSEKGLVTYLSKKSGLLGLSGVSNDIRDLLDLESTQPDSKFALDMMVDRIVGYIGNYWAQLGGLDLLVFTATAGERSAPIRQRICNKLTALGVELDQAINQETNTTTRVISSEKSKVKVMVIPTDETTEIALQASELHQKTE